MLTAWQPHQPAAVFWPCVWKSRDYQEKPLLGSSHNKACRGWWVAGSKHRSIWTPNHQKNWKPQKTQKQHSTSSKADALHTAQRETTPADPSPNGAPCTLCRHKTTYLAPNSLKSGVIFGETLFLSSAKIFDITPEAQIMALSQISAGRKINMLPRKGWNNRLEKKEPWERFPIYLESTLRGTNCIYSKINTMIYSETQF